MVRTFCSSESWRSSDRAERLRPFSFSATAPTRLREESRVMKGLLSCLGEGLSTLLSPPSADPRGLRRLLHKRGISPLIARRGVDSSGIGKALWVVERAFV